MKIPHKVVSLGTGAIGGEGLEYFVDLASVMIDSDGDSSANVYRDEDCSVFEGRYYLNNFKSYGR